MKKIFLTAALASLIVSGYAQSTPQSTDNSANLPPGLDKREQLPPGLQDRSQLPPGLEKRWGVDSNQVMAATNNYGGQSQSPAQVQAEGTLPTPTTLPATGQASGGMVVTNQVGRLPNGTTPFRVQAMTTTDQPIATQVQQVLTAEPVLAQTLPGLNIQVNGGVVVLSGDVQCPAEGVLAQNIIYQKLPRTIRIENRLKTTGGAPIPAYVPVRQ